MADEVLNEYDCQLCIHSVPGEDPDEILTELFDIINNVEILPYDYDIQLVKVGEYL